MDDVERLHYVNGRRLEAMDFRLEQTYLVAMRRRLNRGLFTPGVVSGLEVDQVDATHVRVAPGLALDPLGREIVLVDPVTQAVPAQPPSTSLGGYFLVAAYDEQPQAGEDPDCRPASGEAARIRERPRLAWTEDLPFHRLCGQPTAGPLDCAVALALVSLDGACQIQLVDISPRDIARPAQSSQVQALALEGEKDIDADNPKHLHFVIRGGAAASVVLYLWADRFSSLYYTQLGQHRHTLSGWQVSLETLTAHTHDLSQHTHSIPDGTAEMAGSHDHPIRTWPFPPGGGGALGLRNDLHGGYFGDRGYCDHDGDHTHNVTFSGAATGSPTPDGTGGFQIPQGGSATHNHTVSATVDKTGSPTYGDAAAGAAYGYFGDLNVELDGADITQNVLAVMPQDFSGVLGDTTAAHPLVTRGTPGIELTTIARAVGKVLDGSTPHVLTFRLAGGGGKLLYNLFVA